MNRRFYWGLGVGLLGLLLVQKGTYWFRVTYPHDIVTSVLGASGGATIGFLLGCIVEKTTDERTRRFKLLYWLLVMAIFGSFLGFGKGVPAGTTLIVLASTLGIGLAIGLLQYILQRPKPAPPMISGQVTTCRTFRIQSDAFKYDPFGRRVQKSSASGTTNYPYDGDNPLEEVDASGDSLARYTQGRGPDEPLAELRSGATSYYEADDLGTIASLSNSAGALANTDTYDTFGNLAASTGCDLAPRSAQRFVGFPI